MNDTYAIKELQKICLSILLDIQKVCDKYNLTIMLGGGSALGAVRHKGFIPWDDDIDLNMPREDYEKFKNVFKEELGSKYNLYAPNYSENKALTRFAKIEKKNTTVITTLSGDKTELGICIDIFVIDKIPSNMFVRLFYGIISTILMIVCANVMFYEQHNKAYKEYFVKSNKKKYVIYYFKLLIGWIFHYIKSYKWYNILDKFLWYNGKTNLYGVPTGRKHYFGEIFDKKIYFPVRQIEFETKTFYIPNDVDKYLCNLYGDYMRIPKDDERVSHNIINFTIDE